ncbi:MULTISPECIES: DUF29 domain-containing protein [Pseudanabaena]|uniref:DUF29 domain-containing protein n=2 Tax=Pseudanabaena TaxID=1152 RepID=L8N594_9CYAN|nr:MULTISPECIES: DUF29 domain-containing protein [Pseudanabaena]ELS33398.1 protein of unknown function DUF29 [Pseudanabaena biceps PCC 7429]MDG3494379.1 DUF29 domain-containing protein [Pseudanabaena catenata USMAC16]
MTQAMVKQTLYDTDLNLWLETVISQLRSGDLQNVDIENLIEELEGLAGRDKREVASRLKTLIEHILKRCYLDMPNEFRGWEVTIRTQRFELEQILEQSPSLKRHFIDNFDKCFKVALQNVRGEYSQYPFLDTWQFSRDVDSILTAKFWKI